jgi:hypothetical protein
LLFQEKCVFPYKTQNFRKPLAGDETLTKFKNISYGVYWDQYQKFKTPDLLKNSVWKIPLHPNNDVNIVYSLKARNVYMRLMKWIKEVVLVFKWKKRSWQEGGLAGLPKTQPIFAGFFYWCTIICFWLIRADWKLCTKPRNRLG